MKFTTLFVILPIITATLFGGNEKYAYKKNDRVPSSHVTINTNIKVVQVWEMPRELKEISANVLVDNNRMACVEDNAGVIYIYNLETNKVENKIPFAGTGDYEGLALVGKTYYVLRSDGFLYEINASGNGKPNVRSYDLPLNPTNDAESLFYDPSNNRLLIGVKEKSLAGDNTKCIYSFDLNKKVMNTKPAFNIDAPNGKKKGAKGGSNIKPSEIAINHRTNELYILNGPKSQLLIADGKGNIKSVINLPKNLFPQPEGMCFSPSGDFFISSEGGKKGKGLIAKVQL